MASGSPSAFLGGKSEAPASRLRPLPPSSTPIGFEAPQRASAAAPMAQARSPKFVQAAPTVLLESKKLHLLLLKQANRREGSLAAALVQSMALAVISTAGAYPSWVLVSASGRQVVLGASWAINQADPPRGSPLLGPTGGPLMLAIAFCCLCSVVTGSSAIGWDFLGRRQCRTLGPMLHCLTALLITCTAALGSSLLGVVRGRTRVVPELRPLGFTAAPGQSLFLSFLACALAATATGLSCSSPALVAPARSSRDLGRPIRGRLPSETDSEESPARSAEYFPWEDDRFAGSLDFESSDEERVGGPSWFSFLKRDLPPSPPKERLWRSQPSPQRSALPAAMGQAGESAAEPRCEPERLPLSGIWRVLALPKFMEEARRPGDKEAEQEEPGRGGAEPPLSSAPGPQRVRSVTEPSPASGSQAAEAGLVESQAEKKKDSPAAD